MAESKVDRFHVFLLPALRIRTTEDVEYELDSSREQHLVVCGFGGIRSRSVRLDVVVVHWDICSPGVPELKLNRKYLNFGNLVALVPRHRVEYLRPKGGAGI